MTLTPRDGYVTPPNINHYSFYEIENSDESLNLPYNFHVINSYSNCNVKNNKCFVYPYNYMLVTNNVGNKNIWKYEDFYETTPLIETQLSLTVGCSGRILPQAYKNISKNYDESIPIGKFPTGAWAGDAYTNWLTQNSVNIVSSIGLGLLGVATGNVAVSALGIAGGIANLIGEFHKASLLPSVEGGSNTGDINFSSKSFNPVIHHMRVKNEYMHIIDDYFTRFGYKINRVKVPNITGRTYWNYVEIGQSEDIGYGDVPSNFMEIINNACRKGVTIWHNHSNIGNYSLNNTIVQ